jgi:hypothetical protein
VEPPPPTTLPVVMIRGNKLSVEEVERQKN